MSLYYKIELNFNANGENVSANYKNRRLSLQN